VRVRMISPVVAWMTRTSRSSINMLSSLDVPHTTEVGGVVLGINDAKSVRAAFDAVTAAAPAGCRVDGVLIEREVHGPEVILGSLRDETFGPMVLVGIGGVVAEALDDVALAPAPVTADEARRMVASLAGLRLLSHPRRGPAADLDGLAYLVSVLSRHVAANAWLGAVDLNPIVWSGVDWFVVDAAIEVAQDR
jgi:acetate---CoA ligase (ADP-forming)